MDVVWKEEGEHGLTGDGAEVEVVSDDLLVIVVHRALGEAQVEVVPKIFVNHPPCTETRGERKETFQAAFPRIPVSADFIDGAQNF